MKNKMFVPLLAVVFGVMSAFASALSPQIGWFKPASGPADDGPINFPVTVSEEDPCDLTGSTQCKINGINAYDTEAHANASPNPTGLLKYN